MSGYSFIEEINGGLDLIGGLRTFPISQATRERLAATQGIAAKRVSAVRIASTAFDHAIGTARVQA